MSDNIIVKTDWNLSDIVFPEDMNRIEKNINEIYLKSIDYEEGIWTPTLAGSTVAGSNTYRYRNGSYYRVGKVVTCTCYISMDAKDANMAGYVRLTGLPFPTKSLSQHYFTFPLGTWYNVSLSANSVHLGIEFAPNSSIGSFVESKTSGISSQLSVSAFSVFPVAMQAIFTYIANI